MPQMDIGFSRACGSCVIFVAHYESFYAIMHVIIPWAIPKSHFWWLSWEEYKTTISSQIFAVSPYKL